MVFTEGTQGWAGRGTVSCRADGMGLGLVRVAVKKEASSPSVYLSSCLWFQRSPSSPPTCTHVHTHPRSHGS